MKKILFLMLLLGTLLFCGCAVTTDMEYGIDNDNNAYTRLCIDVNAGDLLPGAKNRVKSALRKIERHYCNSLNFECEADYFSKDEDNAHLILTKRLPADSLEGAFENLRNMLCDDSLTVFSRVSCELSDTDREYAYRIDGNAELNKTLENTYACGILQADANYIKEELEKCSFSVTFSLPDNTRMYRLSTTEPTVISHEGRISATQELPYITELWKRAPEKVLFALSGASLVSLAGIVMGAVLLRSSRKKEQPEPEGAENQTLQNGEDPYVEKEDQNVL